MGSGRGLKRAEVGPRLTPNAECHVGEGFVSVVVPAYNEGDGVKLTLATIDELAEVRLACMRAHKRVLGGVALGMGYFLSGEMSYSPPTPVGPLEEKLFSKRERKAGEASTQNGLHFV